MYLRRSWRASTSLGLALGSGSDIRCFAADHGEPVSRGTQEALQFLAERDRMLLQMPGKSNWSRGSVAALRPLSSNSRRCRRSLLAASRVPRRLRAVTSAGSRRRITPWSSMARHFRQKTRSASATKALRAIAMVQHLLRRCWHRSARRGLIARGRSLCAG